MDINVDIRELKKLYYLLEELNDFFHQEDNYLNKEKAKSFAKDKYPLINEMYYNIVWDWLPDKVKNGLTND